MFAPLLSLIPWITDAIEDWDPEPSEEVDALQAGDDRAAADDLEDPVKPGKPPVIYPVVDLEARAATARYRGPRDPKTGKRLPGKLKRTRYPRVDLKTRRVVIGLHQAGVERSEARWLQSAGAVTCHRAIGPAGNRYRVHPLDRRLICTNRVDRAPWHCIGIETLGNFKGTPDGRWYKPEIFGRGQLGAAQLTALQQEIVAIIDEVARDYGAEVMGILPHRTTGQDSRGRPNRQICCGYEVWSGAGEWAGAELGLRVPSSTWKAGGLTIPEQWHGEYWPRCARFLPA